MDPEIKPPSGSLPGDFVTTPAGPRRSLATMVLAARESVQILLRHVHSDISADQTEQLLLKAIRTREDAIRVLNLTKEAIPLVKHAGKNATIEALQAGGEKRWTSGAAPKVWVWKRS